MVQVLGVESLFFLFPTDSPMTQQPPWELGETEGEPVLQDSSGEDFHTYISPFTLLPANIDSSPAPDLLAHFLCKTISELASFK